MLMKQGDEKKVEGVRLFFPLGSSQRHARHRLSPTRQRLGFIFIQQSRNIFLFIKRIILERWDISSIHRLDRKLTNKDIHLHRDLVSPPPVEDVNSVAWKRCSQTDDR